MMICIINCWVVVCVCVIVIMFVGMTVKVRIKIYTQYILYIYTKVFSTILNLACV